MQQTFLNKKFLIKILILLSFVSLTILSFILVNNYAKNQNEDNNTNINDSEEKEDTNDNLISVNLKLIDRDGNIIFDEIREANNNEVLYDLLVRYHEVRSADSTYGKVIYDIDSVKTKFYSESYISILVNDKYSSFGVSSIYLTDGIRITFKEVSL